MRSPRVNSYRSARRLSRKRGRRQRHNESHSEQPEIWRRQSIDSGGVIARKHVPHSPALDPYECCCWIGALNILLGDQLVT